MMVVVMMTMIDQGRYKCVSLIHHSKIEGMHFSCYHISLPLLFSLFLFLSFSFIPSSFAPPCFRQYYLFGFILPSPMLAKQDYIFNFLPPFMSNLLLLCFHFGERCLIISEVYSSAKFSVRFRGKRVARSSGVLCRRRRK